MHLPVFSKRHKRLIDAKAAVLTLSRSVRRRLLGTMNELNLCGALIVYLVKQSAESEPLPAKSKALAPEDDIPF